MKDFSDSTDLHVICWRGPQSFAILCYIYSIYSIYTVYIFVAGYSCLSYILSDPRRCRAGMGVVKWSCLCPWLKLKWDSTAESECIRSKEFVWDVQNMSGSGAVPCFCFVFMCRLVSISGA